MSDIIEKARSTRAVIEKAVQLGLNDEDSLKNVNLFPLWKPNNSYIRNQKVRSSNNLLYKCVQSHSSNENWPPENTPALWARIDDPGIEYPEWRQPTGAQDSYDADAKVTHNEKKWVNIYGNGNVWEPGVYGWKEVE